MTWRRAATGSLGRGCPRATRRRPRGARASGGRRAASQFAGTIFFSVSTYRALRTGIDSNAYDRLVWTPDALGSICFLVSGVIAYVAVRRPPRGLLWWIAAVNLAGCVAFGISAFAGYVVPSTGSVLDLAAANAWTSLGALCFLIGAVLLLPANAPIRVTPPGAEGRTLGATKEER